MGRLEASGRSSPAAGRASARRSSTASGTRALSSSPPTSTAATCTATCGRARASRNASRRPSPGSAGSTRSSSTPAGPVLGAAHELDEADWDDGLATNLRGVYLVSQGGVAAPRREPRLDRDHGIRGRALGLGRTGGLLRVEGRRGHAHEVPGARRREGRHPGQLRLPGIHRDADARALPRRPARSGGRARAATAPPPARTARARRATSRMRSSTWPPTRPPGSRAPLSSWTAA